jgi:hypothetical protein
LALVVLVVAFCGTGLKTTLAQSPTQSRATSKTAKLAGRWQVKFKMAGLEKNLILVSEGRGVASFLLQDTGPDDKPVAAPQRASWSQLTNDRVSFSGEAELPIGTCCREVGTLIFKGTFSSSNSISGKLIFVTSVEEEESPYKLRSVVGTFSATRIR